MRYSQFFPKTIKEAPSDEVAVNAKLLLRAGFIDKLMAGSYTLLPLGRLVERKIEQIIREEMNATGASEFLMPLLHPKSIWNETGRWDKAREVMYQFEKDEKEFALSFTHEEIFLDVVRKHINSYKDLPVKLYHFSTKFRNELRAKSGILRGREFLMKDLYSAHASAEDLDNYYEEIKKTYLRIFERLGLTAVITEAAGGVFTDSVTHEFQVLSDAGEDEIIYCPGGDFSQNMEIIKEPEKLEGKQCDLGHGPLLRKKAIEVGNIFKFGTSYSEKMNVFFMSPDGGKEFVWMGSYGIGLTRMVGVLAEVFHDEKGLMWPENVAPYGAYLVGLSEDAEKVYSTLKKNKIEVLYDDRDISPGQKFADADLLGIPVRLVVSKKTEGKVEWKKRNSDKTELLSVDEVLKKLS
ncbi:MAG: proline--tRNA ligase [Candidatus Levyibacteriota bacterium]